ncbi:hypothetical protein JMJ77_0009710 [Colletotrichum scovillei]|uniref:Uncharacterized protein n=1 Tax=Colletotrichum scovillei TaxID=1209932 RepID=A0A9P7QYR5_9PEZI|nr:hypothetical protein JMJ77_0009710 [Colletotrichum scovillei]KAG7052791.1 hypothetical protein JMJ78_0005802 [Colletotrichum scovillei]KAG7065085.1 hypothetical protein JMJ76_0012837 [Colletotrichum scovillei]
MSSLSSRHSRLILGSQPLNGTDIRTGVLVNCSVGADSVSRKRQHAGAIYVDDPSTQNVVGASGWTKQS